MHHAASITPGDISVVRRKNVFVLGGLQLPFRVSERKIYPDIAPFSVPRDPPGVLQRLLHPRIAITPSEYYITAHAIDRHVVSSPCLLPLVLRIIGLNGARS